MAPTMATAAFSAALVVSAPVGLPVGHLIDSFGPRRLIPGGSALGATGFAAVAVAPNLATRTDHLGWRLATLVLAPSRRAGLPPADRRADPVGFATYAVAFGLVPLLTERGASTSPAAWVLGLAGIGQIMGRLLSTTLAARTGARTRTAVLVPAGGVTTALLASLAAPIWLVTMAAVGAGMVRGNLTPLQATAVTDGWGTHAYGRLAATLAAPVTIAGRVRRGSEPRSPERSEATPPSSG